MVSNTHDADQAILNARKAFRDGDKHSVRRWAVKAASLNPEAEEPWLLLAAIAQPRASVAYLEQALKINPNNQRAVQALIWARQQVNSQKKNATQALTLNEPEGNMRFAPPKHRFLHSLKWVSTILLAALVLISLVGVWRAVSANGLPAWNSFGSTLKVAVGSIIRVEADATLSPTHPVPAVPTATQTAGVTPTATLTITPTSLPTTTATALPSPTASATALPSATPESTIPVSLTPAVAVIVPTVLAQPVTPVTIPSAGSVPASPSLAAGEKQIVVSLSEQHLYAYQGDTLVFSFIVSTGANDGTLIGTFSVLDKYPNASSLWGFWMPYWLGIYYVGYDLENGIHSLPVLPSGQEIWGDTLGTPASYGCVVLGPENAKQLYDWADIGTPVIIKR
jgi:lipoprotein-anchoring transpeptidase ErfK/SrfK